METRKNVKFQANNVVMIEGTIDTFFEYDHSWKGQRFYNFTLAVRRTSETIDYIPCSISEKIIGEIRDWKGRRVKVIGRFNSYGKYVNGNNMKIYDVDVLSLELIAEEEDDENKVVLLGNLISEPKLRITKKGRKIADLWISVKNYNGKMNSFPVIVWGDTTRRLKYVTPGTPMKIVGRLQSRKRVIRNDKGNIEEEITYYEISAKDIDCYDEFDADVAI